MELFFECHDLKWKEDSLLLNKSCGPVGYLLPGVATVVGNNLKPNQNGHPGMLSAIFCVSYLNPYTTN